MTTQVLKYLIAIAEEHSLTRAAERFYLSQPSLSHHLANAERELGVKLFQKKGRSLQPTEDGIIFLNHARSILYAESQALEQIEELKTQKRKQLRICVSSSLSAWLQKEILSFLPWTSSDVRIMLSTCETEAALDALENGSAEAALFLHEAPLPDGSWTCRILKEEIFSFTVPKQSENRLLSPDLSPLCFLLCQKTELLDIWETEHLQTVGFCPRMICTAPDLNTVASMVSAGLACAFLPQNVIESYSHAISVNDKIPSQSIRWSVCYYPARDIEIAKALEKFFKAVQEAINQKWDEKQTMKEVMP